MTTLLRRALARLTAWHAGRAAHHALTAALYGDHQPARRLLERATPHGVTALAPIAAVWADAYLAATRHADVELVTPLDRWLGEVIAARSARDGAGFASLIGDVPGPLVRHHFEALLRMAALARLTLDDPDPVWP